MDVSVDIVHGEDQRGSQVDKRARVAFGNTGA